MALWGYAPGGSLSFEKAEAVLHRDRKMSEFGPPPPDLEEIVNQAGSDSVMLVLGGLSFAALIFIFSAYTHSSTTTADTQEPVVLGVRDAIVTHVTQL